MREPIMPRTARCGDFRVSRVDCVMLLPSREVGRRPLFSTCKVSEIPRHLQVSVCSLVTKKFLTFSSRFYTFCDALSTILAGLCVVLNTSINTLSKLLTTYQHFINILRYAIDSSAEIYYFCKLSKFGHPCALLAR